MQILNTMTDIELIKKIRIESFRNVKGPLIDLRTPLEFSQGHWPGATNLPLFNNEERVLIGTTYKHNGPNKATALGLKFITPKLTKLIKQLKEIKREFDDKYKEESRTCLRLYCWRGGMRSASVAWLSKLYELNPVILYKGYKAYRNWILDQFKHEWPLKLIGGRTGSGKTDLLLALSEKGVSIIDLEGLANHRGSSFGSLGLPDQPSTEQYENMIGEVLDIFRESQNKEIFIEAESANLGCCTIPHEIFKQMKKAEMIEINRGFHERIEQLVKVYGKQNKNSLKEATLRISKRLGPQRISIALQAIENENWHDACKAMLDYYDRCYEHELSKIRQKVAVDISGLNSIEAAELLLEKNLICRPHLSQREYPPTSIKL